MKFRMLFCKCREPPSQDCDQCNLLFKKKKICGEARRPNEEGNQRMIIIWKKETHAVLVRCTSSGYGQ